MRFNALEQGVFLPLGDGFARGGERFGQMRVDVENDVVGAGVHGGNQRAFNHLMRRMFQQEAVFECARFVFVGVADHIAVAAFAGAFRHGCPFAVGGEACAAHAAQACVFQHLGDVVGRGEGVEQAFAAAYGQPCVQVGADEAAGVE